MPKKWWRSGTESKYSLLNKANESGSTVTVKKSYGMVTVDQAKVIQADIEAKNGVIHVIDQVILLN